jgi:hypothetical protein
VLAPRRNSPRQVNKVAVEPRRNVPRRVNKLQDSQVSGVVTKPATRAKKAAPAKKAAADAKIVIEKAGVVKSKRVKVVALAKEAKAKAVKVAPGRANRRGKAQKGKR